VILGTSVVVAVALGEAGFEMLKQKLARAPAVGIGREFQEERFYECRVRPVRGPPELMFPQQQLGITRPPLEKRGS